MVNDVPLSSLLVLGFRHKGRVRPSYEKRVQLAEDPNAIVAMLEPIAKQFEEFSIIPENAEMILNRVNARMGHDKLWYKPREKGKPSEIKTIHFYRRSFLRRFQRPVFSFSFRMPRLDVQGIKEALFFLRDSELYTLKEARLDLENFELRVEIENLCEHEKCGEPAVPCSNYQTCLKHCKCYNIDDCEIRNNMLKQLKNLNTVLRLFELIQRRDTNYQEETVAAVKALSSFLANLYKNKNFDPIDYFIKITFFRENIVGSTEVLERRYGKVEIPRAVLAVDYFTSMLKKLDVLTKILTIKEFKDAISPEIQEILRLVMGKVLSHGLLVVQKGADPYRTLVYASDDNIVVRYFSSIHTIGRVDPYLVFHDGRLYRYYHGRAYFSEDGANKLGDLYFDWWPDWIPADPITEKRAERYADNIREYFGENLKKKFGVFKTRKVLIIADYGCGKGILTKQLIKMFQMLFGPMAFFSLCLVEANKEHLEEARNTLSKLQNVEIARSECGSAFKYTFDADIVVLSQLLDLYTNSAVKSERRKLPYITFDDLKGMTMDGFAARAKNLDRFIDGFLEDFRNIVERKEYSSEDYIKWIEEKVGKKPGFPFRTYRFALEALSPYFMAMHILTCKNNLEIANEESIFTSSTKPYVEGGAGRWLQEIKRKSKAIVMIDRRYKISERYQERGRGEQKLIYSLYMR